MMRRMTERFGLAVVVLSLLAGRANAGPNLVLNGDFHTGDFTDWSLSGNTGFTSVTTGGPSGHYAALGPIGSDGFLMQQNLATTVGDNYSFSFLLESDGETPNDFSASLAGQTVFSQTNIPQQPFTLHTFTVTATGTSSTISFAFRNDPGFLGLTDISVTDLGPSVAPVPEPSTLVSASIAGLMGLGYAWRRRRSTVAS